MEVTATRIKDGRPCYKVFSTSPVIRKLPSLPLPPNTPLSRPFLFLSIYISSKNKALKSLIYKLYDLTSQLSYIIRTILWLRFIHHHALV